MLSGTPVTHSGPPPPPTKETSQARPCFRACEARPLWVSSSETLALSPSHFIRFWFQLKFRVGPCLTVSRRICFPLAEARGVEQDRSGRHPPAQARGGGPLSARGGAAGRTWAAHVGPLGRGGGRRAAAGRPSGSQAPGIPPDLHVDAHPQPPGGLRLPVLSWWSHLCGPSVPILPVLSAFTCPMRSSC